MNWIDSIVPPATQRSLGVCILYGASSVALSMLNKALLSAYAFDCVFLLLFAQMAVAFLFTKLSRDCVSGNPLRIPTLSVDDYKAALPMGALYTLNVAIGMVGLKLVNVPMFFCIRRLVAPTVLLYEYLAYKKVADTGIQISMALIVMGTIVAGWETLNDDVAGYAITILNNVATAAASIKQKQYSDTYKPSSFGIVYTNACVAAPLALLGAVVWGEFPRLLAFSGLGDPSFWLGFAVSSCMGLLLNYSSMLCTTYNSPLATSVSGNVKDIATTGIGAIAFKGFKATVSSMSGLGLSFLGAFLYSFVNLRKAQQAQKAPTLPVAKPTAGDEQTEAVGEESERSAKGERQRLLNPSNAASDAPGASDNADVGVRENRAPVEAKGEE